MKSVLEQVAEHRLHSTDEEKAKRGIRRTANVNRTPDSVKNTKPMKTGKHDAIGNVKLATSGAVYRSGPRGNLIKCGQTKPLTSSQKRKAKRTADLKAFRERTGELP